MILFTRLFPLFVLVISWIVTPIAFSAEPISPFVMNLNVEKFGMKLGVTRLEMTRSGIDRYRFVLTTKTSGVASWFVRDEVVEISEGILLADSVIPMSYQYEQTGGSSVVKLNTVFDWEAGQAVTTGTSGRVVHDILPGTVDRLSIYLAVMTQLKNKSTALTMSIIDKTKIYDYTLEPIGLEKLDTPEGPLTTLLLKRTNDKPDRETRIWMAPTYDYLPVRIRQDTKGSKDFEMTLSNVEVF